MVPRTFPSSLHPFTVQRQLVALFLDDVTGLQRWVDYIPVNFGKGTTLVEGSYNNNGFIAIQEISSGIGLQAFLDYIPVFFDAGSTDTWNVSAVGFIPYGVSGVTSPPSLEISFTRSQTLDSRITFTRASTATRFNASGVLVSEAIDAPRFDYDPVTLQPKGLLIEEQRTNLLTYSEQFDNAVYNKSNITATANTIVAPDGTLTGETLTMSAVTDADFTLFQVYSGWTSGVTYTQTWYVKSAGISWVQVTGSTGTAATAFRNINIVTGALGNGNYAAGSVTATSVGNGWYRISVTETATSTSASGRFLLALLTSDVSLRLTNVNGDGTSGIYIWGAQLEAGAFPTSYIPTTTAAATRAADVAVMTGTNFSNWYNQSEGTFYAQFTPATSNFGANRNIFLASDGTAQTLAGLRYITSGSATGFDVRVSTVIQANLSTGAFVGGTTYQMAGAYKVNNFAVSRNGGTVGTDTSGTIPTVTQAEIGSTNGAQHILRLAYFPLRLANTELQALTS